LGRRPKNRDFIKETNVILIKRRKRRGKELLIIEGRFRHALHIERNCSFSGFQIKMALIRYGNEIMNKGVT